MLIVRSRNCTRVYHIREKWRVACKISDLSRQVHRGKSLSYRTTSVLLLLDDPSRKQIASVGNGSTVADHFSSFVVLFKPSPSRCRSVCWGSESKVQIICCHNRINRWPTSHLCRGHWHFVNLTNVFLSVYVVEKRAIHERKSESRDVILNVENGRA